MKKFFGLLMFGFLTMAQVEAEAFKSPDILVDSKLDYDFSSLLVSKFRVLLNNYKLDDPFSGRFPEPILVNESKLGDFLPADSKSLIRDFGNAVGLNIIRADTKVHMYGFEYDVKGFKTNLKASEQMADGLVIATDFSASEVSLKADMVSLSLVIPGKNSSPVLTVNIINPMMIASEERLINFFAKIKIQDKNDHFKLQILKANFDQMSKGLISRPQDIELSYDRIEIPKVSLKIGNKTIDFSPAKIQKILRDNHEALKGILLAQVASLLKSNTTEAAFKIVEQYKMSKEYWLNTQIIDSQFEISKFTTAVSGDNIQVNMPGDFCTSQKFKQLQKDCVSNKVTKSALTRLNKNLHSQSLKNIKDVMDRGEANIVASISEDYLNKLLVATYDAGLWKEALDEAGVDLGPNKVIVRLDKHGDSGTLIMDVIYKPSKLEKLLTGTKVIRFPLVLDVGVRIEKHDGDPVVIIRLNDVDVSDDTLINGRPQDNMVSSVREIPRFKTKVAKAIRSKVSSLRGKDIIELRYPEFRNIGLEKVDFVSDGNGRMNAMMSLEDLLQE